MSFLKNLFDSSKKEKKIAVELPDKKNFKVFPRVKNQEWKGLSTIYHIPMGGDLVLVFVQDIDDRIVYVT